MSNQKMILKKMGRGLAILVPTEEADFFFKDGNNFYFKDGNNFIFKKEVPS